MEAKDLILHEDTNPLIGKGADYIELISKRYHNGGISLIRMSFKEVIPKFQFDYMSTLNQIISNPSFIEICSKSGITIHQWEFQAREV